MMRDHTVIEELLAVQALGGLDGQDEETLRRERASHGDCAECRALEAAYTDVAGMLPLALEPEPIDASMADRIIESADDAPASRRSGRAWRALVGVAAAFVLLVGGYAALGPRSGIATQATSAQQVVSFEGSGGDLKMLWQPGQPGALFWGSDMPDPGTGKVYEIWMISGDASPISGGCVSPTDGSMVAFVDADLAGTDTMAVTASPIPVRARPPPRPSLRQPCPPDPAKPIQELGAASRSCARTSERIPPASKYSTSASPSIRTTASKERSPPSTSMVTRCPGPTPSSSPRIEKLSVPSSPSELADSPGRNWSGRTPMPTRLLR